METRATPPPEPFYRIDRPAVDPKLEVNGGGAGGRCPGGAQPRAVVGTDLFVDGERREIAIQREGLVAMVEDDESAEPLERVREHHLALVYGVDRFGGRGRELLRLDLSVELELADLFEQGAFARRQLVGFYLQRAHPLRGALGQPLDTLLFN